MEFEGLIRLAAFLAVFVAVALWEVLAPRRKQALGRLARWPHNIGLLLVDVILLRVLAPGAAIAVAMTAEAGGWGLLNATAMFNHANASVPERIERWLRWLVVTPDMHRVHHSVRYEESSSNFGFNLPWWDRLFGTYRAQPKMSHAAMTIGVDAFRTPQDSRLDRLLMQPFRETPGQYPINRRQTAG